MLAVVQIGSKILRSPCSTARTVLALLGVVCAFRRPGADMAAALAAVPLTNVRRDVAIGVSSSRLLPARAGHCTLFSCLRRFRHGLRYAESTKQKCVGRECGNMGMPMIGL